MHTRVDIILCSRKSEGELLLVVNRIYDALCRLEKMANFYDPASELSVVNRTALVSPIVLSEELYSMIDLCLEYNSRTLGCFDVTVHSENYNQNTIHSAANKLVDRISPIDPLVVTTAICLTPSTNFPFRGETMCRRLGESLPEVVRHSL